MEEIYVNIHTNNRRTASALFILLACGAQKRELNTELKGSQTLLLLSWFWFGFVGLFFGGCGFGFFSPQTSYLGPSSTLQLPKGL